MCEKHFEKLALHALYSFLFAFQPIKTPYRLFFLFFFIDKGGNLYYCTKRLIQYSVAFFSLSKGNISSMNHTAIFYCRIIDEGSGVRGSGFRCEWRRMEVEVERK